MPTKRDEDDDILAGSPALPPLPDADPSSSTPRMPKSGSASDGGTRALAMIGAKPSAILLNSMATIEQNLKTLIREIPGLADIAQPFIDQMRVMGKARLAEIIQGGTGGLSAEAGVPDPTMAPPAMPGGPSAGMGQAPMIMPPPV